MYLQRVLPTTTKVPSDFIIRQILKKHFHLKYKKFNTADYRYRDPTYNLKRLWISKLLAQFLYDDAVIISVDETGLRSDTTKKMKWQFTPIIPKRKF
jgi:hypothetical protein